MNLYKKVEKFVFDSFNKSDRDVNIKHLARTVYWVKELRPDADEALLIAAIAHDIERAFRDYDNYDKVKNSPHGYSGKEHLDHHQGEGAKIISDFLSHETDDNNLIERVKHLVSRHEVGGDDDQNILKDADSISFLENNIDLFLTTKVKELGKEKIGKKFDSMYSRITNEMAKEMARPFYERAVSRLKMLQ